LAARRKDFHGQAGIFTGRRGGAATTRAKKKTPKPKDFLRGRGKRGAGRRGACKKSPESPHFFGGPARRKTPKKKDTPLKKNLTRG